MKIIDAIPLVDKSDDNRSYPDHYELCESLNLGWCERPEDFYQLVKGYWLIQWYCTDTYVGLEVIFFDDTPVAVTWQNARKSKKEFYFLSDDKLSVLRNYLFKIPDFTMTDSKFFQEEIGDHYNVAYNGQLVDKKGTYKGEPVTFVREYNRKNIIDDKIVVKTYNGVELRIPVSQFDIPFHLAKKEIE